MSEPRGLKLTWVDLHKDRRGLKLADGEMALRVEISIHSIPYSFDVPANMVADLAEFIQGPVGDPFHLTEI